MEMTECLQNSRFFGKIISEYLSEVKLKLDIFFKSEYYSAPDLLWKTSNIEVAPPSHTIAYKNIDTLLKR